MGKGGEWNGLDWGCWHGPGLEAFGLIVCVPVAMAMAMAVGERGVY